MLAFEIQDVYSYELLLPMKQRYGVRCFSFDHRILPPLHLQSRLKQADRTAGEDLLSARTLLHLPIPGIICLIPRFVCAFVFTPLPEKELT